MHVGKSNFLQFQACMHTGQNRDVPHRKKGREHSARLFLRLQRGGAHLINRRLPLYRTEMRAECSRTWKRLKERLRDGRPQTAYSSVQNAPAPGSGW